MSFWLCFLNIRLNELVAGFTDLKDKFESTLFEKLQGQQNPVLYYLTIGKRLGETCLV